MRYTQIYDGDWVVPRTRGYKMACCGCGLVHRLNFKVTRGNEVKIQVFRDNRATAQVRRHMRKGE